MTQVPTTDRGAQSGGGASERVRAVASEGKEEVGEIAEHARRQASDLVGNVRTEVRSQTDQQARRLNDAFRDVGRQLRDLADGNPGDGPVRSLAREAADRVDAITSGFEHTGVDGTLSSVRAFARRRPIVFLAGALTAGVMVGRILRNSDTKAILQGESTESTGDGGNGSRPASHDAVPTPGTSASSFDAPLPGMPADDLAGTMPTGGLGPETDLTRSAP